jgi:predicted DNA-binding WGR domain protein
MLNHKWTWKSNSRYYIVRLQENLFGEYTLVKNRGGINNKLGGAQMQTFVNVDKALTEVDKVAKIRVRRGYLHH